MDRVQAVVEKKGKGYAISQIRSMRVGWEIIPWKSWEDCSGNTDKPGQLLCSFCLDGLCLNASQDCNCTLYWKNLLPFYGKLIMF